jgi:Fe-S-cluster containining protein
VLEQPFYARGLRFSCTRCSKCCRHEPGFVFLSESDTGILAETMGLRYTDFVETYCRWVPAEGGMDCLSLREQANFDCVFWKEGCSVYEARPLQCRTFPFWRSILISSESWSWAAASCPGMGKGALYPVDKIRSFLALRTAEPLVKRKNKKG